MLAIAASAEAYIYFGNATTIGRAANDGTQVDRNFIDVDGFACGVAVTPTHIYWADLGSIGRANLDGTGVEQDFITFDPFPNLCGIAVDANHVYWANRVTSSIGRASLAGTGFNNAFVPLGTPPCGVAVDETHVYYASNSVAGALGRALVGTGAPVPGPGAIHPASCAVGVGPGAVYYGDFYGADPSNPIHAVTKAGINHPSQVPGSRMPCGIVATPDRLLWTNYINPLDPPSGGSIGVATLDEFGFVSAPPDNGFITGVNEPCGIAIDNLPQPSGGGDDPTFALGKARLNRKKGTAALTVSATAPGSLALSGKSVKAVSATLAQAGATTLAVKAKGKTRKALKKKGKAKVAFTVEYVPTSGTPASQTSKLKLRRKR
jgi:hypothetical protein